jgi:hypothetical protein
LDNIPKPVNDHLGRYIETNIALLTENKPRPHITPKSEDIRDVKAAELSELTIDYLWEALDIPDKLRDIVRMILYTGTAWMELAYDESLPRRLTVPQTEEAPFSLVNINGQQIKVPVPRQVLKRDKRGQVIYSDNVEYGDINATIVSPFEMHVPSVHYWEDIGWIMREYYVSIDAFQAQFEIVRKKKSSIFKKTNGWYLENLEGAHSENVTKLPLWWWERIANLVEGPGPTLYVGTPEQWDGYAVVRILDRKPSDAWPRGRTVITLGDKVIYDSPKDKGARAYDPRWPHRWHPYVKFTWEKMVGSVYGRSLVSKLLPKIKRLNAIDTTMIMWRRTVPISAWIMPRGSNLQKDIWSGRPGILMEYDVRATAGRAPEVVHPPSYPEAALREREMMIQEMEFIAGTEEILRGQRPSGVGAASAMDLLRKQALASRSATLQTWDESLQKLASAMLQETIRHVRNDPRYLTRINILAREKASALTIHRFTGEDISDNVIVRINTIDEALLSREAKEAKALEFVQYAGNLMALPFPLRQAILDRLGYEGALNPAGTDVDRARRLIGWVKTGEFERVIPFPEDDPYVFYELLVQEIKKDSFWDLDPQQQGLIFSLIEKYRQMIEFREMENLELQAKQIQQTAIAERGGEPEK